MRETVINLTGWRERGFDGRNYRVKQNISADDLKMRLHMTLDHEVEVLEHQFTRNSVMTVQGEAKFVDSNTIEVHNQAEEIQRFSADKFILAVGTKPFRPASIPFDGEQIIDSDDLLRINRIPRTLTVVGAGVVGAEYATIFSALDVPVTVIDPRDPILEFLDRDLISELIHQLKDRGVQY